MDKIKQTELFWRALQSKESEIISTFCQDLNYTQEDGRFLWSDLATYMSSLISDFDLKGAEFGAQSAHLSRVPWGSVLVTLPKNALIPLLPMIAATSVLVGNTTTFLVPGSVGRTYELISQLLSESYGSAVVLEPAGIKGALERCVTATKPKLLYYIGSSRHIQSTFSVGLSHGAYVIFEGEGKSIAIVEKKTPTDLRIACRHIVNGKTICNGQLCTSPNTVFVARNSELEFKQILENEFQLRNVHGGNRINPRNTSKFRGLNQGRPFEVEFTGKDAIVELQNIDQFCSRFYVYFFDGLEEISSILNSYDGGIQASIFVDEKEPYIDAVAKTTSVGRIVTDFCPVIQDSRLPWGGYSAAGMSEVRTFSEKLSRAVIIEQWAKL